MGLRVLVVEDEALIAWNLAALVDELGYELIGPAATFETALDLATATHPDIALVDIQLLDGDCGIRLAEQLQRLYGTVAIATSADSERIKNGAADSLVTLSKPYTDELVREALNCAAARRLHGSRPPQQ